MWSFRTAERTNPEFMRFDVCMDNMEAELNIYPASQTDYFYLMDNEEHLICYPFEKRLESGVRTEWTLHAPKNQVVLQDKKEWLLQQQTIGYTGWELISAASLTERTAKQHAAPNRNRSHCSADGGGFCDIGFFDSASDDRTGFATLRNHETVWTWGIAGSCKNRELRRDQRTFRRL